MEMATLRMKFAWVLCGSGDKMEFTETETEVGNCKAPYSCMILKAIRKPVKCLNSDDICLCFMTYLGIRIIGGHPPGNTKA